MTAIKEAIKRIEERIAETMELKPNISLGTDINEVALACFAMCLAHLKDEEEKERSEK